MKEHPTPREWAEEFGSFATAPESAPPAEVSARILARVRTDLDPAIWLVGAKLSLIHLVVGTLTLLFCPQFGIDLGGGEGLMGLLMRYGEGVCMLGCGAVFMAGSALVAALALRAEEVRKIRRKRLLLFPGLAFVSAGALVGAGGTLAPGLALIWCLGSILGGLSTLEIAWRARKRPVAG